MVKTWNGVYRRLFVLGVYGAKGVVFAPQQIDVLHIKLDNLPRPPAFRLEGFLLRSRALPAAFERFLRRLVSGRKNRLLRAVSLPSVAAEGASAAVILRDKIGRIFFAE
jgi:hypothetical protein